jgi:hypothetical protein
VRARRAPGKRRDGPDPAAPSNTEARVADTGAHPYKAAGDKGV